MGHDQYSVPQTAAVEAAFVAFIQHSQTYVHGLSGHSFKLRSNSLRSNERKLFTA